jgi:putative phosphoribosyl transferase
LVIDAAWSNVMCAGSGGTSGSTIASSTASAIGMRHAVGRLAGPPRGERVGAVVSRGGRPDLAGEALGRVTAPTLLIVGRNDPDVLRVNQRALTALAGKARLEIVPGATREEPDALARVAVCARNWFLQHLV